MVADLLGMAALVGKDLLYNTNLETSASVEETVERDRELKV